MNKKLIVALIIVVVVGGAVWAYFATRPNVSAPEASTTNNNQSQGSSSNETPQAANELRYTDSGFSPKVLTVKIGTTVRIVNQSASPLEFSSDDHPTHTKHPEFNLDTIPAGSEGKLEVKTAGAWGYHNHVKADDAGLIIVTEE